MQSTPFQKSVILSFKKEADPHIPCIFLEEAQGLALLKLRHQNDPDDAHRSLSKIV